MRRERDQVPKVGFPSEVPATCALRSTGRDKGGEHIEEAGEQDRLGPAHRHGRRGPAISGLTGLGAGCGALGCPEIACGCQATVKDVPSAARAFGAAPAVEPVEYAWWRLGRSRSAVACQLRSRVVPLWSLSTAAMFVNDTEPKFASRGVSQPTPQPGASTIHSAEDRSGVLTNCRIVKRRPRVRFVIVNAISVAALFTTTVAVIVSPASISNCPTTTSGVGQTSCHT